MQTTHSVFNGVYYCFQNTIMALVAPVVVFIAMICGGVAALVWPEPSSLKPHSSKDREGLLEEPCGTWWSPSRQK